MKAGRPSSTARLIAAATILLASDRRTTGLVAPGAAKLSRELLSATPGGRWLARGAGSAAMRPFWRLLERSTHPGIIEHYWNRKRWIEARCREAIATGHERLVVIGAGFDTLAYRLARERSDLEFVEVDHPATQAAKARVLMGTSVRLIRLDLSTEPIPLELIDSRKATIVIMEGLLMYLPREALDRLFASLRSMCGERVCVIFSFMTRWPDGTSGFRPRSALVERWLAWRGEPFTWALEPEAIGEFLAARGFRLEKMVLASGIAGRATSLEGENLVACVRAGSALPFLHAKEAPR